MTGLSVALRTMAAFPGGYLLSALWTLAWVQGWPGGRADAVLIGTISSFLVWTSAAIWAFAATTALRAWLGLFIAMLGCGFAMLAGAGP